ncbi:putative nucleotidyltransferase substrate binding domain-containing protein [Calidifontibacter terrae]
MAESLAQFLGRHEPFAALGAEQLARLAAAAQVSHYASGELVLDAFEHPSVDVFVVISGAVNLWNDAKLTTEAPDEQVVAGGVFGFSAMLTERSIGPLAVAARSSRIALIPGSEAGVAFTSRKGAQFLAANIGPRSDREAAIRMTAESVLDRVPPAAAPLPEGATAAAAARQMSDESRDYAVVRLPDGSSGLVTDHSLRRQILVEGQSPQTPARDVVDPLPPRLPVTATPTEVLLALLDTGATLAMITDRRKNLQQVVHLRDVAASPVDVSLHERIRRAETPDALVEAALRVPELLRNLLRGGLSSDRVIRVNSTMIDGVTKRALELSFEQRNDVRLDDLSFLMLGSNGRREAVLSSDVDTAAAFPDDTPEETMAAAREAFAEAGLLLARVGLTRDKHGAIASRAPFSRTRAQWLEAASTWVRQPAKNEGGMFISLLLDSRPLTGDPTLADLSSALQPLRTHAGTMRLLLGAALSTKARYRAPRPPFVSRSAQFDIKRHAILPVVNLARWAALAAGVEATTTKGRLTAASGSPMLPRDAATSMVEVFGVLQRLRLHYQLAQTEQGERPSDALTMQQMSLIDRSLLAQAVREISAVQRRMANVSAFVSSDEWTGPQLG